MCKQHTRSPEADTLRALAALDVRDVRGAATSAQAAVELDCTFAPALLLVRAVGQWDPALLLPAHRDTYAALHKAVASANASARRWVDNLPGLCPQSPSCVALAGCWHLVVEANHAEARRLFSLAAAKGSVLGMSCYASLLLQSGHENERAKSMLEIASAAGHALATANLGLCHLEGLGTAHDAAHAVQLFEQAAAAGLPHAMRCLSRCLTHGEGLQQRDSQRARKLMVAAAELGDDEAQYEIGVLLLHEDYRVAKAWLSRAAGQGHAEALTQLGCCVAQFESVQDMHRACELWRHGAASGRSPGAAYHLRTLSVVEPDEERYLDCLLSR